MPAITKQAERFTETDIDDEIVVMRLDNGEFFSLAGTGAAIWRLIDGKRDRAALLTALAGEYDCDQAGIESDVDRFLVLLRASGLIADD